MGDIMRTVKSLEEKDGFLSMLLGTLSASLSVNLLTSKRVIRAGEGTIRARQEF